MATSPLTKGLVAGKTGVIISSNMTVNPTADNSTSTQRAKALLASHDQKGFRTLPPKSGAKQMGNGASGRKISGAATLHGGRF